VPPDRAERRPVAGGGAQDAANVKAMVAAAADVRRRRAASWRLPPLASGHRDPLDALAGLPIADRGDCCRGEFTGNGRWRSCCGRGVA
jgi:hypothetical protein